MVKTKLSLEEVRQFKTSLMRSDSGGQICLVIDNTEEIRIVVLGTLYGDGGFTQNQIGANWVVETESFKELICSGFTPLEIGSEITIVQK